MTIGRKRSLAGLLLVGSLSLTAACGGAPPAAAPTHAAPPGSTAPSSPSGPVPVPAPAQKAAPLAAVTLSYPAAALAFLPFFYGIDKGIYERAGIDLKMEEMIPPAGISGLLSGQVDFMGIVGAPTEATIKGYPIKRVLYLENEPPFALLADRGITSLKGLVGKSVGVTVPSDALGVSTRLTLEKNHVPLSKVGLISENATENIYRALVAGAVQGGMLDSPFIEEAQLKGYRVLAWARNYAPFGISGLTTTTRYLQKHPRTAAAVVRATLQSLLAVENPANRAEVEAYVAPKFNLSPAVAKRALADTIKVLSRNGSKPAAEVLAEVRIYARGLKVNQKFTISQIEDMSLQRAALAKLGGKG